LVLAAPTLFSLAGRAPRSGHAAAHNQRELSAPFIMPHGLRDCELAMTLILKFYDASDVCRIF
jgi:hypothetical protein